MRGKSKHMSGSVVFVVTMIKLLCGSDLFAPGSLAFQFSLDCDDSHLLELVRPDESYPQGMYCLCWGRGAQNAIDAHSQLLECHFLQLMGFRQATSTFRSAVICFYGCITAKQDIASTAKLAHVMLWTL